MKHLQILLPCAVILLLLSGCGYRAPLLKSYIPDITDSSRFAGIRGDYMELAALLSKDTGLDPTGGNTLGLLPDRLRKRELLLDDLDKASESVLLDYYRFVSDTVGTEIMDILSRKASTGKEVAVILDRGAHSRKWMTGHRPMPEAGVELYYFYFPITPLDYLWLPKGTNRDHRKIVITDGTTAYAGGRNIQDKYFSGWHDCDIRITGPATAHFTTVFNENLLRVNPSRKPVAAKPDSLLRTAAAKDSIPGLRQFYDKTVQVVPDTPTDKRHPVRNCFLWSIWNAKRYFWFYNPYTPPPVQVLDALKDAAARGVDVRWIAPSVNDVILEKWMAESLYESLLKAGIRIYEWQGEILHAKMFVTDDYLTAIGSANMDNLSFFMNLEVETIVYDEELTCYTADIYREDIEAHCREITLEEVRRWSFFRKLRNWLTKAIGGHLG